MTYGGARIVLTKHGKPAAALVSMDDLKRIRAATPAITPLHTLTCDTQAPRERVWRAITDASKRADWWQAVDLANEAGLWITWHRSCLGCSGGTVRRPPSSCVRTPPDKTQVRVSHTGAQPPSGWALHPAALREYVANVG